MAPRIAGIAWAAALLVACGARSEILVDREPEVAQRDAASTDAAGDAARPVTTATALVGTYRGRVESHVTWVEPPNFPVQSASAATAFRIEADNDTVFRIVFFENMQASTVRVGVATFPCIFTGRVVAGRALLDRGTVCRGVGLVVVDDEIVSGELRLDESRVQIDVEFVSTFPLGDAGTRYGSNNQVEARR